jgi:hypothetical protein
MSYQKPRSVVLEEVFQQQKTLQRSNYRAERQSLDLETQYYLVIL